MDQQPNAKNKEIIAGLAVLIIIVVIVATTTLANKKDSSSALATTSSTGSNSTNISSAGTSGTASSSSTSSPTYTDGSYTAASSYSTPGGIEDITVKVTVQGGVVTDSSVTNNANNSDSREYQDQFASGYKQLVVGKAISSLSLSRVSGSSLTSQGFNNALDQIRAQARQSA